MDMGVELLVCQPSLDLHGLTARPSTTWPWKPTRSSPSEVSVKSMSAFVVVRNCVLPLDLYYKVEDHVWVRVEEGGEVVRGGCASLRDPDAGEKVGRLRSL